MAKYTDEQIKKALECCYRGFSCMDSCPFDDRDDDCSNCTSLLAKAALDLINRQEADYKHLCELYNERVRIVEEQDRKIVELEAEIERLKKFKMFFEALCGFDLEVLGYTEDGDTIPFDVLYENAIKEMVGETE